MKKVTFVIGAVILMWAAVAQAAEIHEMSFDLSQNVFVRAVPSSLPSPGQTTFWDLGGGDWQIDSFFDVFTEISIGGGSFQPVDQLAHVDTIVRRVSPQQGGNATIDVEIVALSLVGSFGGGTPIEIRPAGLPSPGQTTITDLGGGQWQIDSFFDVFTEISIDGGLFQSGLNGTVQTTLIMPEPSMALIGIGMLALMRKK